jgi:hypothetical protein
MAKETYSSLEDTFIAPIRGGCFTDLIIRCLWVDNAILSGNLVLISLLVLNLLLLVAFQLSLELVLHGIDLAVLGGIAARPDGVGFEVLDLVANAGVEHLGARHQALQRGIAAGFWAGDGSLMQGGNLGNVAGQRLNVATDAFQARQELRGGQDVSSWRGRAGRSSSHWGRTVVGRVVVGRAVALHVGDIGARAVASLTVGASLRLLLLAVAAALHVVRVLLLLLLAVRLVVLVVGHDGALDERGSV